MPSKMKVTKEEIQTIFKLSCRVTELKTNLKGIYDSYECSVCGKEEESQAHIIECEIISKLIENRKDDCENNDKEESIDDEEIFGNNVKKLVKSGYSSRTN